jgi:hypothetical protein
MLQAGLVEVIQPVGMPAPGISASARAAAAAKSFPSADEKRSVVNRLIDRIKRI